MKMILRNILILFLISSCNGFTIKDDVRRAWSTNFNACLCQNYSFRKVKSLDKFVQCEEFFEQDRLDYHKKCQKLKYEKKHPERCLILAPEQYCNNLVGFKDTSWAKNITPRGRETKAYMEDSCKGK